MRYRVLRNCCSRGSSSSIHTVQKALGLLRQPDCLPISADACQPEVPPFSFIGSRLVTRSSRHVSGVTGPVASPAPNKRSIVYLIHRFFPEGSGGTEAFLGRLASWQQARGNKVRVIALSVGFPGEYPEEICGILVRRALWNGIEVLAIRYQNPPPGLYYEKIDEAEPIQRDFANWCMEQFHPDLVHAVYPQPFAAFLQVCREKNIPYMISATDFSLICPRGTLIDSSKNKTCADSLKGSRCLGGSGGTRFEMAGKMLRGADFFTVPSVFSAERFAAEMPGLQPIVIPHDIEPGFSYRHRNAVRYFAFFGSLKCSKGVFVLVRAFRKLNFEGTLRFYGEGPLSLFLKIYGLLDRRIRVMGSVARKLLPSCYEQVDCVVIPSLTAESYSMVFSEAIASGCMIIASDVGALPQRVQEAGGRTFRAGDTDALYEALLNAIRSPVFPLNRETASESECEAYESLYQML